MSVFCGRGTRAGPGARHRAEGPDSPLKIAHRHIGIASRASSWGRTDARIGLLDVYRSLLNSCLYDYSN